MSAESRDLLATQRLMEYDHHWWWPYSITITCCPHSDSQRGQLLGSGGAVSGFAVAVGGRREL